MAERSPIAVPFIDDVVIEHGPQDLISRFLFKALDAVEQRGIRLSFGTFEELAAVNEQNSDSWLPLTTTFRADIGGANEETGFVFMGRNAEGDAVATQAVRLFDWQSTNFKREAESLRFFYADPDRDKADGETCTVSADAATLIRGRVALAGGIWYRPDYRRLMLPAIIPRIARAYALTRWNMDAMMAIMSETNIARGLAKRNGFRDISWSVVMHRSPTFPEGDLELALARMNQMDLVDDLFRFVMDFETQVDGGVEVRRA